MRDKAVTALPVARSTDDNLMDKRDVPCDTEGCEDRAVWQTSDGQHLCDGCHDFAQQHGAAQ